MKTLERVVTTGLLCATLLLGVVLNSSACFAGPASTPWRPTVGDAYSVHRIQTPELREFRRQWKELYGNPNNNSGGGGGDTRQPQPQPPQVDRQPTKCPQGYQPNRNGGCDVIYVAPPPKIHVEPPRKKTCQPGYTMDSDGDCNKIVVAPPRKRTCLPGYTMDSDGDCNKIVVAPPPPKTCQPGYERDSDGDCNKIVVAPSRPTCAPPKKWNARGECVFEYVAPPTPPPAVVVAPPVTVTCPPGQPVGPNGQCVKIQCGVSPGRGPETEWAGTGNNRVQLARGSFAIIYGSRARNLIRIADLPVGVSRRSSAGRELYADAYVDVGAQTSSCSGQIANGGELRMVDIPMINGGLAPACVLYCGASAPVPPSAPPPQVITSLPNSLPVPPVVHTVRPAVPTIISSTYSEPLRPAVPTVVSVAYTEPPKAAVPTVISMPFTEPQRAAVPTVISMPFTEPQKAAVPTLIAAIFTEPENRAVSTLVAVPVPDLLKPAVPTLTAQPIVEPSR